MNLSITPEKCALSNAELIHLIEVMLVNSRSGCSLNSQLFCRMAN